MRVQAGNARWLTAKPSYEIYSAPAHGSLKRAPTRSDRALEFRLRLDSNGFFSAEALHAMARLREVIAVRTFTFALNPGQGYIIDNWRYLHGRLTVLG